MFNIRILGNIQIEEDGQAVSGFRSLKALALLGYLCVQRQPVSRAYLVSLFWPDMTEARGRRNLSWVLSQLSKFLPGAISANRQTIQYVADEQFWLDADDFRSQIASGSLTNLGTAVELYQDELMTGIYLDDCPEFETWLVGEREIWRQRMMQALSTLILGYSERQELTNAIEAARRLLGLDTLNEDAHRQLMRLLALNGQLSAALSQYRSCVNLLAEELGVEPAPETTALFQQIQSGEIEPIERAAPPPLSTVSIPRPWTNVPAQISFFVGRRNELKELYDSIEQEECRLLSLIGPGGVGKTQLSLQLARGLGEGQRQLFNDGIYFVPLELVNDWIQLINAISEALHLTIDQGKLDPESILTHYLGDKKILLIFDGFEHLLHTNNQLLSLLQNAPGIKVLVTSRVRLKLSHEWAVTIGGLAVPQNGDETSLADYGAVRLFLHKARQNRAFIATSEDMHAIAQICRMVEGMPLGIELAATWTRLMSPAEILRELEHSLDLLTTEEVDVPDRHRSLYSVVAASWELLSNPEQATLQALTVFPGSFTRHAARDIANTSLQTLATLIDNSLVQPTSPPGRYRMHAVVRSFITDRLREQLRDMGKTESKHAHYFANQLASSTADLRQTRQKVALEELMDDIDNVRAAWQWGVNQPSNAESAAFFEQILQSVFHVYDMRSWFEEGAERFAQAANKLIDHQTSGVQSVGHLLRARHGWFLFHLGKHNDAYRHLSNALTYLEANAQPQSTIFARNYLGAVTRYQGDLAKAKELCLKNVAVAQMCGDRYGEIIAHNILAQINFDLQEYEEARRHGQQSLAYERELGNRWSMGYSLVNLGNVALAQGQYDQARQQFSDSLSIREEIGDVRGMAICLERLGECAEATGQYISARSNYLASLQYFRDIGNHWGLTAVLANLGRTFSHMGENEQARQYLRECLTLSGWLPSNLRHMQIMSTVADWVMQNANRDAGIKALQQIAQHPEISEGLLEQIQVSAKSHGFKLPVANENKTALDLSGINAHLLGVISNLD